MLQRAGDVRDGVIPTAVSIDAVIRPALRIAAAITLCLASSGAGACGGGERVCTLVGCESNLIVRIEPPLNEPYRVEVYGGPATTRRVVECTSPSICGGTVAFENLTPPRATFELIVGTDTTRREIANIRYSSTWPNGKGCGRCDFGEVTFVRHLSPSPPRT
jgi:hypothetical protein